eukprot:SAG31_NODE_477_length_15150_cov_13.611772_12_plen_158_part_00
MRAYVLCWSVIGDAAEQRPTKAKFSPTTIVTTRRMSAGEELTFPYVDSPSRARLLTSFGFMCAHGHHCIQAAISVPCFQMCLHTLPSSVLCPWRHVLIDVSGVGAEIRRLHHLLVLICRLIETLLGWLSKTAPRRGELCVRAHSPMNAHCQTRSPEV